MSGTYKEIPPAGGGGGGSVNSVTASSPVVSSGGVNPNISMPQSSGAVDGWLSSGNFNIFNAKVSGGGATGRVAFWNGSSTQASSSVFSWNNALNQFGVGLNSSQSAASVDVFSDWGTGIADLSGLSTTLVAFPLPVSPTLTISQTTPDIQEPGMSATPSDIGAGQYNGGDVVDFVITPGYNDGSNPIIWGVASRAVSGITDASIFDIDIAITPAAENFSTNIWSISRQVNGGGYNDFLRTTATTFTDTNTGWSGGPDDLSNKADDFLSTGIDYSGLILGYGTKLTPISTTIVSLIPFDPMFTDDNSGLAYKMDVQFTSGVDTPYRLAWPNTRTYDTSVNFISGPIGPTSNGSPEITPTAYGYVSDGSALTRQYDGYSENTSPLVYSANVFSSATTDPNDGLNYYIQIAPSGGGGSLTKIIRDNISSETVSTGTTFYDDGVTPFSGDTVVLPTTLYVSAGRFSGHGASINDTPTLIIKSADGSYSRLEFQTNADQPTGYIENQSGTMKVLSGTSGARLTLTNTTAQLGSPALTNVISITNSLITLAGPTTVTNDLTISAHNIATDTTTGSQVGTSVSQKLSFHGATPVVQRSGAAQAAVATTASTQTVPFGYTTQAQADALVTLVNEIRATLVQKGLMKGSA